MPRPTRDRSIRRADRCACGARAPARRRTAARHAGAAARARAGLVVLAGRDRRRPRPGRAGARWPPDPPCCCWRRCVRRRCCGGRCEHGCAGGRLAAAATPARPAALRGLADPTAEQMPPEPPERSADAAAGRGRAGAGQAGRLLPAVLAAPARADAAVARHRAAPARRCRRPTCSPIPAAIAARPACGSPRRACRCEDAPDARIVAFRAPGCRDRAPGDPGRPAATASDAAPLVRLHSECFTGDLLGSLRCDCGPQLRGAIAPMAEEGAGVLLYLAQEGRGIGLVNKLRAYALQDRGLDTLDANRALGWGADERNFLVAATMLEQLGIAPGPAADQQPGQDRRAGRLRHRGRRARARTSSRRTGSTTAISRPRRAASATC